MIKNVRERWTEKERGREGGSRRKGRKLREGIDRW